MSFKKVFLPFLLVPFIMEILMDVAEMGIGDVGVDLGRGDVGVAEKRLNATEIGAVLEKIGRKAVSERVRSHLF